MKAGEWRQGIDRVTGLSGIVFGCGRHLLLWCVGGVGIGGRGEVVGGAILALVAPSTKTERGIKLLHYPVRRQVSALGNGTASGALGVYVVLRLLGGEGRPLRRGGIWRLASPRGRAGPW